ncbi:MAG: hypothetical protein ABSH28_23225 [Acidobacteriota bacterium]
MPQVQVNNYVRVKGRPDLGTGEVVRLCEDSPEYRADVAFEGPVGRRLETIPVSRLEKVPDLWKRLAQGDFDDPVDYALKQLAFQFPVTNSGGELSSSRTDLLPRQLLLTHDVVAASRWRLLIADEVGLGKTIETGMIIREEIVEISCIFMLAVSLRGMAQLPIWGCYVNFGLSAATPRNPELTTNGIVLQSNSAATGVLTHFLLRAIADSSPCSRKIKLVDFTLRQGAGNRRRSGRQAEAVKE